MNLLVVDWDYFFPSNEKGSCPELGGWELWDWGHHENMASLFLEGIWPVRAAGFIMNGYELPGIDQRWRTFWQRFKISKRATLFHADSNMYAAHERVSKYVYPGDQVWLFDAHHDAGYRGTLEQVAERGSVSCEDWMLIYSDADLHMRYPQWETEWAQEPEPLIPVDRQMDDGAPIPVEFDRVFVCRSGCWTPPWGDKDYAAFLEAAPVKRRVQLDARPLREWSGEIVTKEIEMLEKVRQMNLQAYAERQKNSSPNVTIG